MQVLALSHDFQPSAIIPWERSLVLLYEGKVESLIDSSRIVRSPSVEVNVPEIVRFKKGGNRNKRAIKFSRDAIYLRDQGKCQYCSQRVSRDEFTYDHVIPRQQGGLTIWQNVVVSCVPCNQKKGGRTPEQAGMRLITLPIKPTKLPKNPALALVWKANMPESWRSYMSREYWNEELEK